MADITKCSNSEKCPRKDTCYRHTAPSNPYRQSMATYYREGEKCTMYWFDDEAEGTE